MTTPGGDDPSTLVQQSNYESLKQNAEEAERLVEALRAQAAATKEMDRLQKEINKSKERYADLTEVERKKLEENKDKLADLMLDQAAAAKQREKDERKYGQLVLENLESATEEAKKFKEEMDFYSAIEKLPMGIGKVGAALRKAGQTKKDWAAIGNRLVKFGEATESPRIAKFGTNIQTGFTKAGAGAVAFGMVGAAALLKISKALLDIAVQVDDITKQINTGLGKSEEDVEGLKNTFRGLAQETATSGVTMQEAGEAFKVMISNVSMFNSLNSKAQKKVGGTIAKLQKLGIATATSADAINFFGRALNMSAGDAADLTAQIALMGQKSGITSKQMMENFTQLKDRIAVFGKESTEVLKNLSLQARAAGVSVGTLSGISSKFDNFSSAADTIAQLNAVIGTNIDMTQMMNMTDDQQIDTLVRSVRARTGSIESLDKHTQRFIANALGAKSVAEAQQLINMDPSEFDEYNKSLKEQEDVQKVLAEQTKQLVPVMNRFKILINELMLEFEPVGREILSIISGILSMRKTIMSFIVVLTSLVAVGGTVFGILKLLAIAGVAMNAPFIAGAAILAGFTAAVYGLYKVFTLKGSPEFYNMPQVIGENFEYMGKMASSVGDMLKSPIKSLHGMWDIFHKSGSPDLYELPQAFADNFASIEQSVKGTMGSLTKFISVMRDFASLDYDGFVAVKSDGTGTSMVMGSEGIIKQMSEGKLQVEVKMPEIKMPQINIEVIFKDQKLEGLIEAKIADMVGGAF